MVQALDLKLWHDEKLGVVKQAAGDAAGFGRLPAGGFASAASGLLRRQVGGKETTCEPTQLSFGQNTNGGIRPTSKKACIGVHTFVVPEKLWAAWRAGHERRGGGGLGGERMFCCYCSSDSLCKLITLPT